MLALSVGYPSRAEEEQIVMGTTGDDAPGVRHILYAGQLVALQHLVRWLPAAPVVVSHAVSLARRARPVDPEASAEVKRYVSWGMGPGASQHVVLGAKARAAMDGRPYPDLEDVNALALPVRRHRIVLNFKGEADGVKAEELIPLMPKR